MKMTLYTIFMIGIILAVAIVWKWLCPFESLLGDILWSFLSMPLGYLLGSRAQKLFPWFFK